MKNETHALWTWQRNQDMYNKVGDQIYIVRQPERCPIRSEVIELWGTHESKNATSSVFTD